MGRLVSSSMPACARVGNRLATLPNAPLGTLHRLALDDAIEVAGRSWKTRKVCAKRRSSRAPEPRARPISLRYPAATRSASVTDILVERGNQEVVLSTARNAGAESPTPAPQRSTRARPTMLNSPVNYGRARTFRGSICSPCSNAHRSRSPKTDRDRRHQGEMFRQLGRSFQSRPHGRRKAPRAMRQRRAC